MRVVVCIKQVPEAGEGRFDPATRRLDRASVPAVVNPFDRRAIALAVDLTRRLGGTSVALTLGPPQARAVLVEALASGIDRAIHLCDPAFAGSDTLATARALAAAIRRLPCDLVVCGKYTVDGETGQVGPEIAELLGLPQITGARRLIVLRDGAAAEPGTGGTAPEATSAGPAPGALPESGPRPPGRAAPARIEAERESDEGYERVEAALPALVTTAERLIQPIRPEPEALARSAGTPIETWTAADLGLAPEGVGAAGSPTAVLELRERRVRRAPVRMQTGSLEEQAEALAGMIRRWRAEDARAELRPLPSSPPLRNDAGAVWVVAERRADGRPTGTTLELLGEAAWLARRLGGYAAAVVLDADLAPDALAAHGADRVLRLHLASGDTRAPEARAAALAALLARRPPPHAILFSASEHGREVAPRMAARLGLGLTGDCIGLTLDVEGRLLQIKPALGTEVVAPIRSRTTPQVATIRPGTFTPPAPGATRPVRVEDVAVTLDAPPRGRVLREAVLEIDPAWRPLEGAAAVVGVGTGIAGPESLPLIRRFAAHLDAALGATRRVTDRGWLPRQLQIGLTGRIVAPRLYVAVGVRGAPNHTIGIRGARTIVALNLAPDADIFASADVGFVGDFRPLLERTCGLLEAAP